MSALEKLQLEDLDQEQQEVAEVIGLENYKQLMARYGGTSIYIPKTDRRERRDRNEQIRSAFNGYNFRELAQKFGLTEVTIRSIFGVDGVTDITSYTLNGALVSQESGYEEFFKLKEVLVSADQ